MWEEHASFARPPPPSIVNRCSDSITVALPAALNRFSRVACFWAFKAKNVYSLFLSLPVALSRSVFLSFAFAKNNQSVWARNVFVLMFKRRRRRRQQQYAQSASGKWWSASGLSSTSSLGFSSAVQCEWLQTSLDVDGRCRSLERNEREGEGDGRWHMLKRRSCTLFRMSTDQSTNEKVLPHRCLLDISPQQRKDINEYLTRIIFITADGEKEEKRLRSRSPVPRRRVQFPDSAVVFSDDLFAPSRTEIS